MRITRSALALLSLAVVAGSAPPADDLDRFVAEQMALRHVPGLSLAVIQGGRIVETRAYGVTELGSSRRVTTSTLFQAGSISKSVAAAGALRLVEQGKLSLDADVNATLTTWKVPASPAAAGKPVTLRGLLSHTAGLTVHGFPGYAVTDPMPTLVQVLDGVAPANTAPIRVEAMPGARWNYSGGGYTIMQQMVLDVVGEPFPAFMRRTVLVPVGMRSSSYEQPLPASLAARTAAAHLSDGRLVPGRWHVYPEMAAAGLWTTPSDLARFAIEIQQAYAGKSNRVISRAMATQMLTDQKDKDGLGVFLTGEGQTLMFNHGGRDEGFDAQMSATATTGQGVVIMINANDNSRMVARIQDFVAKKYKWPGASTYTAPAPVRVPAATLESYAGRYEFHNNDLLTFVAQDGRLYTSSDGHPDEAFVPLGDGRFASADRPAEFRVVTDGAGGATSLVWRQNSAERTVPRVGPLTRDLASTNDADPSLTTKVQAALRALGTGDSVSLAAVPALTAGMRRDFARGPWGPAASLRNLTFITRQSVAGRGIERHDGAVESIAYYSVAGPMGSRTLLVYLTRDGMITDFDLVAE